MRCCASAVSYGSHPANMCARAVSQIPPGVHDLDLADHFTHGISASKYLDYEMGICLICPMCAIVHKPDSIYATIFSAQPRHCYMVVAVTNLG